MFCLWINIVMMYVVVSAYQRMPIAQPINAHDLFA